MNYKNMLQAIQTSIVPRNRDKKITLFCLPFAGGSATLIYNKWKLKLADNIVLKPVELAGRGNRILEDFYNGVPEAIDDIYSQIENEIDDCEYAIFGHSMGAFLTYELVQRIQSESKRMPLHIFFSGRHAPNITKNRNYSGLDDKTFKERVLELGATPKVIFENPELRRIFIPILRNDFKIAEAPSLRKRINPLRCDLTVLIGEDEGITGREANDWKLHTTGHCKIDYIEGGHFFLLDNEQKVLNIINEQLQPTPVAQAMSHG